MTNNNITNSNIIVDNPKKSCKLGFRGYFFVPVEGGIFLTQNRLAMICGVTQGYISQIIKGERRPSWVYAKLLAYHTGTRLALWMEGSEDEKRAAVRSAGRERAS